ncbi:uncharacterized protein LOC127875269 [Dreissena polymorpha]|uniref:Uncharacterized protein n=1 Tax=Dreissena polymorpha TaxID=45954 RepID=A0A9D4L8H2_DREPO|nr:uncharacterized protein LOC127875269 [Dreissena polymorpha]KAH3853390.1 hypothetical protein DPMN_095913 [Dreissena polymorpha]
MCGVFNGYELLLFKKFDQHPAEWIEWRDKLREREEKGTDMYCDIPEELWFLVATLRSRPQYLMQLVRDEIDKNRDNHMRRTGSTLLTTYLNMYQFTEFHLDSIFKYGEDNSLPKEIFKCPNIRHLSLKYNCLYYIPPDIGRLQQLEYLALTNNRLHVQSIPHTLIFCTKLHTLLLDNNHLDALPGFLLQMPNIETVHRHGNHNYFKSTFMWYHTDVYCRIMPLASSDGAKKQTMSLQFWAAKALIGTRRNFFTDDNVASVLKDYLCDVYEMFNVCHKCARASSSNKPGFKVITFKNPYLGNTCVPFQHWVCSLECARDLEVPARHEQVRKMKEADTRYERYVRECQKQFNLHKRKSGPISCISREAVDTDEEEEEDEEKSENGCDVCSDSCVDVGDISIETESEFEFSVVQPNVTLMQKNSSDRHCIIM